MANYQPVSSMLKVSEVSQLLHIHSNTVRRWCDRGILRAYRITSRGDLRFRRAEVIRFMTKLKEYRGDERKAASSLRSSH